MFVVLNFFLWLLIHSAFKFLSDLQEENESSDSCSSFFIFILNSIGNIAEFVRLLKEAVFTKFLFDKYSLYNFSNSKSRLSCEMKFVLLSLSFPFGFLHELIIIPLNLLYIILFLYSFFLFESFPKKISLASK